MKIVPPSAELLWITPDATAVIERAGRVCYKSEEQISPESSDNFIAMLKRRGHFSVVEHASASILFVCDRGVTHEMVRHRMASYSQESTRYCNYGQDRFGREITLIEPPFDTESARQTWLSAMQAAETSYLELLDQGVAPQIARGVLPNSLKTEIVMTANFREWFHFLELRGSPAAHPQMRETAMLARNILRREAPQVFQ